jgi:hypothetical protein
MDTVWGHQLLENCCAYKLITYIHMHRNLKSNFSIYILFYIIFRVNWWSDFGIILLWTNKNSRPHDQINWSDFFFACWLFYSKDNGKYEKFYAQYATAFNQILQYVITGVGWNGVSRALILRSSILTGHFTKTFFSLANNLSRFW